MSEIFSPQVKYTTWRRLWIALAKAQKAIGLPITVEQIRSMEKQVDKIDLRLVAKYEKEMRHDVMAHLHAFGDRCPQAKGILHLGATSCYITDNTDVIQMRSGLSLLQAKLIEVIRLLKKAAEKFADLPTLSFTHFQPAQPTTVGKRVCLWLQDFLLDFQDLSHRLNTLAFLGLKGATGTQASFLTLCECDPFKAEKLDELIAIEMGFSKLLSISGQTYTRKQDMQVLQVLEGLAATCLKCATDLRLLSHMGEMAEGLGPKQIGSSAMPYKQNPVRCERVCGLARFLLSLSSNTAHTFANQWLERTLDDSANRRLTLPEAFLTADSILNILLPLFSDLKVYPKVIEQNLSKELPFLALENILMSAVKKGKDRQEVHERLRRHAFEAKKAQREEGKNPDLLSTIASDSSIGLTREEMETAIEIKNLIGRAPDQVAKFLELEVEPLLKEYRHLTAPVFSLDV